MPMKRHKPEQIVTLLRQIEVETANGKTTPQACRDAQITVQTFYRWRKEYGGLKLNQAQATQGTREGERQAQASGGRAVFGEADPEGCSSGKLLSPERRRAVVELTRRKYGVSERYACRVLQQWRGTQRYLPMHRTDEDVLTQAMIALAIEYGRYGYRRITMELRKAGWQVGKDRVQRIWRRGGVESTAETEATRAVVVERRVHVCGCGRNVPTTSGATISSAP